MASKAVLNSMVLDDKENLLKDVSKAYREGTTNDISFILSDNVIVQTNKQMLAWRVPYFETFLFGGFAEDTVKAPIPLKCCSSDSFKQILHFVWEGELSLAGISIQVLLDLLETSRFLCLDALSGGVVRYWSGLIDGNCMGYKDALVALDFTIEHEFNEASQMFLRFIGQNLAEISCLAELQNLTEISIKMVIEYQPRFFDQKVEIDKFKAFAKWLENKNDVAEDFKSEMLDLFYLNEFASKDVAEIVKRSNLYEDAVMCETLGRHVLMQDLIIGDMQGHIDGREKYFRTVRRELTELQEVNERVVAEKQAKEVELFNTEKQVIEQKEIIDHLNEEIQQSGKVKFEVTPRGKWNNSMLIFDIPANYQTHFINKVCFTVGVGCEYRYSYKFKSSKDGTNWTDIATLVEECGLKVLHFERMKAKCLAIQLLGSDLKYITPYVSSLTAMMI